MTLAAKDKTRAKDLGRKIQHSIKAAATIDIPYKDCLDALARGAGHRDWKSVPENSPLVIDPQLAANALAHDAGLPARVLSAIIAGSAPRLSDHELGKPTAEILKSDAARHFGLQKFAPKAGALILGPGLQGLCHTVGEIIRRAGNDIDELGIHGNDPRIPGILTIALFAAMDKVAFEHIDIDEYDTSDYAAFHNRIKRSLGDGDVRSFDDAIWQLPPVALRSLLSDFLYAFPAVIDHLYSSGQLPSSEGRSMTFTAAPMDPCPCPLVRANYDGRWRRLDAPDMSASLLRNPDFLFETTWIRIARSIEDPDVQRLGIKPSDLVLNGSQVGSLPDEQSDAIWILGIGTDQRHIEPISAVHFVERPITEDGRLESYLWHLKTDAGALHDRALITLGEVAAFQLLDDFGDFMDQHGPGFTLAPICSFPDYEPNAEFQFVSSVMNTHAALTQEYGPEFCYLESAQGGFVQYEDGAIFTEPRPINPILVASKLGPNPWGCLAHQFGNSEWIIVPLSEPTNSNAAEARKLEADLAAAMQQLSGTKGVEMSDQEAKELVNVFCTQNDVVAAIQDQPMHGHLHRSLARRNARILIHRIDDDDDTIEVGFTYASPQPGETLTNAAVRIMETFLSDGPEEVFGLVRD